jgi:hypothetical protein
MLAVTQVKAQHEMRELFPAKTMPQQHRLKRINRIKFASTTK